MDLLAYVADSWGNGAQLDTIVEYFTQIKKEEDYPNQGGHVEQKILARLVSTYLQELVLIGLLQEGVEYYLETGDNLYSQNVEWYRGSTAGTLVIDEDSKDPIKPMLENKISIMGLFYRIHPDFEDIIQEYLIRYYYKVDEGSEGTIDELVNDNTVFLDLYPPPQGNNYDLNRRVN